MTHQSAFDKVLGYIAENGLSDGDTLPPERTLAEELGLSRRELRAVLGAAWDAGRSLGRARSNLRRHSVV